MVNFLSGNFKSWQQPRKQFSHHFPQHPTSQTGKPESHFWDLEMTVPSQDWSLEASVFPINKTPGANFSTKDLKKNVTSEATENTPIAQDLSNRHQIIISMPAF